ncbi:MAG: bifunctional diaminohydroxyphosphoribosylaminopyrimidine deaminase/5-amino-6-(5-phosphoribosylamino)uracil reductase RibD [Planctomycetota bacterium]
MIKEVLPIEEKLMRYVFNMAIIGEGYVEPNPLVGALIVKNGMLLSIGYHRYFGGPHAEIEAINKVPKEKLKNSELYINLEPCCHRDKKTLPCLDTIINIKFKGIYISNRDPNPKVSGRAIQVLKEKGYKVRVGILEEEGKFLNRAFFKSIVEKIPYIVLKIAVTKDGKIGLKNKRVAISSKDAMEYAKEERDKFNAILVGANTINIDNPILLPAVRKLDIFKTFYRIIISTRSIKLLLNKKILKTIGDNQPLIFATTTDDVKLAAHHHPKELTILTYNQQSIPLKDLLKALYSNFYIGKLLVEGGAKTFRQFFDAQLFDELHLYKSDKTLNDKNTIKLFENDFDYRFSHLKLYETKRFSNTLLLKYMNNT